jgi:hypothetical protein
MVPGEISLYPKIGSDTNFTNWSITVYGHMIGWEMRKGVLGV